MYRYIIRTRQICAISIRANFVQDESPSKSGFRHDAQQADRYSDDVVFLYKIQSIEYKINDEIIDFDLFSKLND